MTETLPRPPWYRRDLLPAWLPTWLVASTLIGLGFAIAFGLGLGDTDPWGTAAVAGALGFGLGLVILTVASARSPKTPEGQRLAPPAVIRKPIFTALLAVIPLIWVMDRRINAPGRHGSGWILVTGTAAEVIGLAALVAVAAAVAWTLLDNRRRRGGVLPSDLLSFAVAGLLLGYAGVRFAGRHP